MLKSKHILLLISFIEGASVMATEISGAKLLAPYYGNSLYVWSSVMAVTLSGLAFGYFFGGKQSKQANSIKKLSLFLLLAGFSIITLPYLSILFNPIAQLFQLVTAVIISVCVILFIPVFLMGTTSPLIISTLTTKANESGESSGIVYAISTLGGIMATFLCGFYLIPNWGIKNTLLFFGLLLILCSALLFFQKKNPKISVAILFIPLLFFVFSFNKKQLPQHTLFESEGIFGKLTIKEEPSYKDSITIVRKLLINNIVQTEMNTSTKRSVSDYIHLLDTNMNYFPKTGNALVVGLGGGLAANLFHQNNYKVTGVEFDNRIIDAAKNYFYLNTNINALCDDARHFINVCNNQYNIILFDVFKAEEQPAHVITQESVSKIKMLLTTNGLLLINWHGYINGEAGLGTQCLLNTLKQANFYYKICETNPNEDYRNLLIIASQKPITKLFVNEIVIPKLTINTVNTDDKPILEKLNAIANTKWRINYLQNDILK